MLYSALNCLSNYSFLKSASHPHEMVEQAYKLGYQAIAITDECSLAGIVKAHTAAKNLNLCNTEGKDRHFRLLIGSEFILSNQCKLVVIAPNKTAYSELSDLISYARRDTPKGTYQLHIEDLRFRLRQSLIIFLAQPGTQEFAKNAKIFKDMFKTRLWIGLSHQLTGGEQYAFKKWVSISKENEIPMIACDHVIMHKKSRKPLHDVLCAIDNNTTIDKLGTKLHSNAEAYLKPLDELAQLYPQNLLDQTQVITNQCTFSMDELRYQYPRELVPSPYTPIAYLNKLVAEGQKARWPKGVPNDVKKLIKRELALIEELNYEYYFLTVYDIVRFARKQNILCQGRGSAANSVVCYCLYITEIQPGQINVLFERFISKERDEPPDIDVDFEHQRREEVIQYIYQKYTRKRAALAATVVTYRSRSAIRDVGKALGLDSELLTQISKSLAWWDRKGDLLKRVEEAGMQTSKTLIQKFFLLTQEIAGFPRHLSQHVGGFVITQDKISNLVPVENASMPDRTVIQWDKEDLEDMRLLKVDVLALGMLTALRKALGYIHTYMPQIQALTDIPREDKATYDMLCRGDSLGVFQIESRAQMSMLPRLRPRRFYDLVIEIAIVRPGPIQGDMVHPYLRRRDGLEAVSYENPALKEVLGPTLGVPIFQEQAIRLAMVAAGFSGGEADQLRRAMASWGKNGNLMGFEHKFIQGMLNNGYTLDFAKRVFEQIKGFGGYGFPESHSASFALLCYTSSWIKCHHPAAFYCALLNSQPMGFYSASQLLQDARRHQVKIFPVDINKSTYENQLEAISPSTFFSTNIGNTTKWGIRLGFSRIKSLNQETAEHIVFRRGNKPFTSLDDIVNRCQLSSQELQILASSDALFSMSGHRHLSRWYAAATRPENDLIKSNSIKETLYTPAPCIEKDILTDYDTNGVSLRPHIMALLRQEKPFKFCKTQAELSTIQNGGFVRVAGLVTGRQRPGTAKGTVFLTLEDETGNINIIVWSSTQTLYRQALLTGKLLLIKGRLEQKDSVIHIIAGQLQDYSHRLESMQLKSRDFH